MKQANRFDVLLQIRAPEFLAEALDRAASSKSNAKPVWPGCSATPNGFARTSPSERPAREY